MGGFVSLLPEDEQPAFFDFWAIELLTEELFRRFPDESRFPDKLPPSLAFVVAAAEEHRREPKSRAYLFCLNLLALYAVGWRPDLPTRPMLPGVGTIALPDKNGRHESPWARKAQDYLVDKCFAKKIGKTAYQAFTRHAKGRVRSIKLADVQAIARQFSRALISGQTLDELARDMRRPKAWSSRVPPDQRPIEYQRVQRLQEELERYVLAAGDQWASNPERGERESQLKAEQLALRERYELLERLEKGQSIRLGSFWPHRGISLVGYLFGTNGVNGQLYRRLRDWLKWEREHGPGVTAIEDVEGQDRAHQALTGSSPVERISEGWTMDEGTFDQLDDAFWTGALGKSAHALNIAILKGRLVYKLKGRTLRSYLRKQGFSPPSAEAIRSRYAHLRRKLQNKSGRPH